MGAKDDFVCISANCVLKMTTILKELRIAQLYSKNEWLVKAILVLFSKVKNKLRKSLGLLSV